METHDTLSIMPEIEAEKPYRFGALAYIYHPDKHALLLVQLNSYADDEWNLPGGGRLQNETAEENVLREMREELNLGQDELRIVGESASPNRYDFPAAFAASNDPVALAYKGQQKDQFFIQFVGNNPEDMTLDEDELKAMKWCPVEDLPNHLKFPGQLEVAQAVLKEFKVLQ